MKSVTFLFRTFVSPYTGKIHSDKGLDAKNPVQVAQSTNMGARFITDEMGETYTNWRADPMRFDAVTLA